MYFDYNLLVAPNAHFRVVWLAATGKLKVKPPHSRDAKTALCINIGSTCEKIRERMTQGDIRDGSLHFTLYLTTLLVKGVVIIQGHRIKYLECEVRKVGMQLKRCAEILNPPTEAKKSRASTKVVGQKRKRAADDEGQGEFGEVNDAQPPEDMEVIIHCRQDEVVERNRAKRVTLQEPPSLRDLPAQEDFGFGFEEMGSAQPDPAEMASLGLDPAIFLPNHPVPSPEVLPLAKSPTPDLDDLKEVEIVPPAQDMSPVQEVPPVPPTTPPVEPPNAQPRRPIRRASRRGLPRKPRKYVQRSWKYEAYDRLLLTKEDYAPTPDITDIERIVRELCSGLIHPSSVEIGLDVGDQHAAIFDESPDDYPQRHVEDQTSVLRDAFNMTDAGPISILDAGPISILDATCMPSIDPLPDVDMPEMFDRPQSPLPPKSKKVLPPRKQDVLRWIQNYWRNSAEDLTFAKLVPKDKFNREDAANIFKILLCLDEASEIEMEQQNPEADILILPYQV